MSDSPADTSSVSQSRNRRGSDKYRNGFFAPMSADRVGVFAVLAAFLGFAEKGVVRFQGTRVVGKAQPKEAVTCALIPAAPRRGARLVGISAGRICTVSAEDFRCGGKSVRAAARSAKKLRTTTAPCTGLSADFQHGFNQLCTAEWHRTLDYHNPNVITLAP
jgi:hypothetical protein